METNTLTIMGFDLYGLKATSEKGAYFRNNIWWWRPLAGYVLENVDIPEAQAKHWQYNDGITVSEKLTLRIADTLEKLIAQGQTQQYEQEYKQALAALPDEVCVICKGQGVRNDEYVKGTCNGCNGTGRVPNFMKHYPFDVENVKEFAQFCRDSGGFTIC
jgi:hypothetical protein